MTDSPNEKKTAGAFDVRTIIGALLGIYGVILLLTGLLADAGEGKDESANLWAGLGLLLTGAFFLVWVRLKPIVVPDDVTADVERPTAH